MAVIRNCFDASTEILTEAGWKLFKDVLPNEKVAQLLDDGRMEFVRPSMHYRAPYVGEMVGFENEGVDFLVTPDHRLSVSKLRTRRKVWGEYEFKAAQDCYGSASYRVKRDATFEGANPRGYSEAMFEWLGFWFAEGSAGAYHYPDRVEPHWRCVITQIKTDIDVGALHDRAGLPYTMTEDSGARRYKLRVTPVTKPLILELSKSGDSTTKRVPRWVMDAPASHLRAFIRGHIAGDGNIGASTVSCTASRQLASDLQEMALRAGLVANITLKQAAGAAWTINGYSGLSTSDYWAITFVTPSKHQPALKVQGYAEKYRGWYKQQYKGMVYCLEVPTHRVYVRRNGRAHWSSQTFGELKSTTIKTWQEWIPEEICPLVYDSPIRGTIKMPHPDGKTMIECEVLFASLDKPKDIKKVLSLELTAAWINEAREMAWSIVLAVRGRCGRFPKKEEGSKLTQYGLILDTNPPDTDHWWFDLAERKKEPGGDEEAPSISANDFEFFTQPPALIKIRRGLYVPNPDAENVENHNLGYHYWLNQVAGATEEWIKVYLLGRYGFVMDGKLVYPEYRDDFHTGKPRPNPLLPLLIGFDFGLTPACAIGQVTPRGSLHVFREFTSTDMGIQRFGEMLKAQLAVQFPDWSLGRNILATGDPSGDDAVVTDESTCFDTLRNMGFDMVGGRSNSNAFVPRREAVAFFLNRADGGKAGFVLDSEHCPVLRKGFLGGYHLRRMLIPGKMIYRDVPDKDAYSHPHDALQYLAQLAMGDVPKTDAAPSDEEGDDYAPSSVMRHGDRRRRQQAGILVS